MADTMRAARFDATSRRLEVVDVPIPVPRPTEVLIRVEACGICLSDVHLLDGTLPTSLPVVTPGHEVAGTVEQAGDLVSGWTPGDQVVVAAGRNCGQCVPCTRGVPQDCDAFEIMGFGYDGGWAQYLVAPAAALSLVPRGIPIEQAAVLADAVSTPYAALTDRAGVRPGEAVGLWGIGGLGVHAVQVARLLGAAPIVAVDPLASARERALRLGADVALDPTTQDVGAEIARLTGGRMLDVAVDLVGANVVLRQAVESLGRRGRAVMVGLSMDPVEMGPGVVLGVMSQSLLGHLGYEKRHLDELVRLVELGRLDVSGSVSDLLPLDDVAHGVGRLTTKEGDPIRLVVQPWA